MNKAIVTTTINLPTEAIRRFIAIAKRDGWKLYIVGDKKTNHDAYQLLQKENKDVVVYMHPDMQEMISKSLSDAIGWNCIQRRNFGFIQAIKEEANVIATIDDDNIPYTNWGTNIQLGFDLQVLTFEPHGAVFDPLGATNAHSLWHRGFPHELLEDKNKLQPVGMLKRKPLVQADLWNGDPDVDAVCRIAFKPDVRLITDVKYAGTKISPFNSQNTFLHANCFPHYFLFPGIGRMDDIWASYHLQHEFPDSVVYGPATVYQQRNEHNLVKDLEAELLGYHHSLEVATDPKALWKYLPDNAKTAFELYQGLCRA